MVHTQSFRKEKGLKYEGKSDEMANKDWRTVNVEPKGDTMGIC